MEAIKTYKELRYNLNHGPGYNGYLEMVKAIDLPEEEWQPLCHLNPIKYTRNCIYNTDELEVLVSCWPGRHSGPIHNYNLQQGWIKVLQGTLTLEFFDVKDGEAQGYGKKDIKAGDYVWLNDTSGFHQFRNEHINRAVAVHIYIDKIKEWQQFHRLTGEVDLVKPGYDFVHDEA